MPKHFKSLTDVISKDKAFLNFRKSVQEHEVINEFDNIFPKFSKTVFPSNVRKGILYLIVENSVLRNEIYLNKSKFIEKINNHFNKQIVIDIKFANFRTSHRKSK